MISVMEALVTARNLVGIRAVRIVVVFQGTAKMRNKETTWAPRALQAGCVGSDAGPHIRKARASQLLCQRIHPKMASNGKMGHFYMLVKTIGIRLERVGDLHYLIHFGSSCWKRTKARDITVLTSRWTLVIQYFCPSSYETPIQIDPYWT